MALEISARIRGILVTENIIEEEIKCFWKYSEMLVGKDKDEKNSTYEELYNAEGFIIRLIKQKKYPYNIYDSEILNDEYQYNQIISFDIDKTRELNVIYNNILEFLLYLYQKYEIEVLVTSDFSEEICWIMKGNKSIVNKKIEFIDWKIFSKYNINIC